MHRQTLVVLALSLAATVRAQPPLVEVPGRRAESRRGRGYRPDALVRALRMSHNQSHLAPARAAALPWVQKAQEQLATPGTKMTRDQLSKILSNTPFEIGKRYYEPGYRKDVPPRFVKDDSGWRTKTVENPEALPIWKQYVAKSLGEAEAAKRLLERRPPVEKALTAYMDRRFVSGRGKWKEILASADESQLFDAARTMMLRINDIAHNKRVPQEQVGAGASYSSHQSKTLLTRSSAASGSNFHLNQLVPHAATFVFKVADGANLTRGSMIPHEARAVVEIGIQIQDIQRELQRRRSELAAPVARWVDGSRLSFNGVGQKGAVEIRMDRASVEAVRLESMGILSPKLKGMLATEKSKTANRAMSNPNPLLDSIR